MHHTCIKLNSSLNYDLEVNRWTAADEQAVVQIAHGMAEHSARYGPFAQFLTNNHISVYAHDHRGHGKLAQQQGQAGLCPPQRGWQYMIEDMLKVNRHIKESHPGKPVFMLGHSMGSLLAINFAYLYGDFIDGLLLTGVASPQPIFSRIGLVIAALQSRFKGIHAPSQLLHNMLFGGYNKHFMPARTDYDWLSTNTEAVDNYIADPHCGIVFCTKFFYDLARATLDIYKVSNLEKIPKTLPLLLMAGSQDAVGHMTKGVEKVYQLFQKAGIKDLKFKIYDRCRHELLNEEIRLTIYQDIINWISSRL
ncbi:MAG: lysophospholipase [Actinomycetota bacterium]|nr:lysophospholipase [Actinomycetota bacterium]